MQYRRRKQETGNIIIKSDSKFEVKTYLTDGSYIQTISPDYSNGVYSVNMVNFDNSKKYYFSVHNKTSSPMKNAKYEAYKEGFDSVSISLMKNTPVYVLEF